MQTNFKILNSLIDSISIINKNGEIIFTNTAWKKFSTLNSGSLEKTDCGVNYLKICKKVTGEELDNANNAVIGIDKIIRRELDVFELEYSCHSDNEKRWFIMRVTPYTEDSELTIISHINITARKIAEETIAEKNKQLNLINEKIQSAIYKIIHDIQSPLASIEGLINLIKIEKNERSADSYLELIEKSVINLKKHIQHTLRVSTSLSKIELIIFKELLHEFYESIKHVEPLNKIDYRVNITQNYDFYSHKDEINSIISNIVGNCLKYYDKTKQQCYIIILIEVDKKNTTIAIKDNGIGMSKKVIDKILDMDYKVDKNSSFGTDIGMRIVKDSVKKLNGSITVNSKLGQGSEFIITIPNL